MGIGEACDGADVDRVVGNLEEFYRPSIVGEVLDPSVVDFVVSWIKFGVPILRVYSFGKLHFASQLAPVLVILLEAGLLDSVTQIKKFKDSPVSPAENLTAGIPNIAIICFNDHLQKLSIWRRGSLIATSCLISSSLIFTKSQ